MNGRMERGRNAWKAKLLEPAQKPKEKGWTSAKPASPVRRLSAEQMAEYAASLGVPLKASDR